jgi:hypothetical protein
MGTEKLTVTITHSQELIIRSALPAGIDGPILCETAPKELTEVDTFLSTKGFTRVQPWQIGQAYDGMYLEAELVRS